MAAPKQRNVDWGSAEVADATLTVELTGARSKAWKQRFESVLTLLDTPHNRWGEVHLNREAIQVADVQPGTETELRHFLESIVLQVNSELPQPEESEQDAERETHDEAARADRRMTTAFRAFADD
jgi:BioD-like phosphotransacetylase family protein